VTTFSHLPGLSHLDNFCITSRLATLTQKSDYLDQWQASNPAHLPGLLIATPPNKIKESHILLCDLFVESHIRGHNYLAIKYFQNKSPQALDSQVMFRTFVYSRSFKYYNTKALAYFLQGNLVNFIKTKRIRIMPTHGVGCSYLCLGLPEPPCSKLQFHAFVYRYHQ
jgi:hypothetical protein